MHATYAYGLWLLVVINSLIFILFALSFTRPCTGRWAAESPSETGGAR